jgi:hypothetical protein
MDMPVIDIPAADYEALPILTAETLPPTKDIPLGFKCRNGGGYVCEWVKREDMFANQVSLLSAPERGFRYFTPRIIPAPPLELAEARVKRAEVELVNARADLEKLRT